MLSKSKTIIIVILLISFISDRISKIIAINFFLKNDVSSFYYNSFLNFILTWNRGVAFGLLHSENYIYHFISIVIFIIIILLIFFLIKSKIIIEKISYSLIIGGACGNFFDRLYYNSVPDFIDFHFKDFHWFTFNFADIWITLGILLLLFFETFNYKKNKNE